MALKSRIILEKFLQHQRPLPSVSENDIYDVSTKAQSGWFSLCPAQLPATSATQHQTAAVLAEHVVTLLNRTVKSASIDQGA